MNFLVSRDNLAYQLREKLEFWILPCMNPDGIVCGNYRCNT
jgi:cytosolic carboxypeptidase protein 2/3